MITVKTKKELCDLIGKNDKIKLYNGDEVVGVFFPKEKVEELDYFLNNYFKRIETLERRVDTLLEILYESNNKRA